MLSTQGRSGNLPSAAPGALLREKGWDRERSCVCDASRTWNEGGTSMLGLMQDWPLLLHKVIDFAALQHANREVVSRTIEGPMHRTNYAEVRDRALRGAQRLQRDGVNLGDRVATLAWNGYRHLEAWYAIVGLGAVYHTVNPRLFPEQIA